MSEVKHTKWMNELDFFFNKVLPKKLIVFVVGTIAMFLGIITGTQWLLLAGAYGGIMFAQKWTQGLINGNRSNSNIGRGSGDLGFSGWGSDLDDKKSRTPVESD